MKSLGFFLWCPPFCGLRPLPYGRDLGAEDPDGPTNFSIQDNSFSPSVLGLQRPFRAGAEPASPRTNLFALPAAETIPILVKPTKPG